MIYIPQNTYTFFKNNQLMCFTRMMLYKQFIYQKKNLDTSTFIKKDVLTANKWEMQIQISSVAHQIAEKYQSTMLQVRKSGNKKKIINKLTYPISSTVSARVQKKKKKKNFF